MVRFRSPVLGLDPQQLLIAISVLLVSLTVHEAAHAWSADRLGDPTARLLGRVSLNPLVHIDPIGTVLFPLLAIVTGIPILGWAKPVPVNTSQLGPHWKRQFMLIAAAGPASNLVLAGIAALVIRGMTATSGIAVSALFGVLFLTVQINVLLAVFNMFPVPPLDGGNVLAGLLRGGAADLFDRLRPYGFLIIYGLMLSGVLWAVLDPVESFVLSVLL